MRSQLRAAENDLAAPEDEALQRALAHPGPALVEILADPDLI